MIKVLVDASIGSFWHNTSPTYQLVQNNEAIIKSCLHRLKVTGPLILPDQRYKTTLGTPLLMKNPLEM